MLRRFLLLFILLFGLPAVANAWTITASSGGGGTISPKGTMTIAGTTGTSQKFDITPNNGYVTYRVLVNGVIQPTPPASSYTLTYNGRNQSITAYFKAQTYTLTPSAGSGGTIYPNTPQTVNAGSSKTFSISPNAGSVIADVKVNGESVGPVASYTFINVQAIGTIDATFTTVQANAGGNRTIVAEGLTAMPAVPELVNLDASASTGATSYSWALSSIPYGSTAVLSTPGAVTASFSADKAGPYYIRLTAANGTATSTSDIVVNVTKNAADAAASCIGCHSSNAAGAAIVQSWKSSSHTSAPFGCEGCHIGADNSMPGAPMNVSNITFKALTTAGPLTKGEPTCFSFVSPSGCHNSRYTSDYVNRLSVSSHPNATVCSSCHSTDMHAQDGKFINKCGKCHSATAEAYASKHGTTITGFSCRSCHTGTVGYGYNPNPTVNGSNMSFSRLSSASASKHRPETFQYATSDVCAGCHSSLRTEFRTSTHWNNNLEYGTEFAGGAIPEQMNANESWTTTENGTLTTCSIRCHFKPNLGPNPKAKNTNAINSPGKDECLACHDPHTLTATYITCLDCHRQTNTSRAANTGHGLVPWEFWGSKHWQNNLEYGSEFANQTDTVVSGPTVTDQGTKTDAYLNANDSYTTTENGSLVTCAYRCHFRPGMGPEKNVGTVLANGKSTGYITYVDTLGKYSTAGKVYSRPGGDACMACHDEHGLEATAQSTCYTCHAGGNHGWSVAAFEKSTHFTGTYAKADGMAKESCLACHNAHSTEAEFANMTTPTLLRAAGFTTGCQKCHAVGASYGIYSSNGIMKSGHAPGAVRVSTRNGVTSYSAASYIQPDDPNSATCVECHYHDNSVNAGYAESGHGKVDINNSFRFNHAGGTSNINWQNSPQASRCSSCHSPKGYAKFADSNFTNISTINPIKATVNGTANVSLYSPLTCDACHVAKTAGTKLYNGKLRNTKQYTNYNGYSSATIVPKKLITAEAFPNWGASNTCIPCHTEGRGEGTRMVKKLFAADTPVYKQYSAGAMGIHALPAAGVVNASAGYDFASAQGYQNRMKHQSIGQANYRLTGTSGPCVTCHMTTTGKTHSLEAVTYDATGAISGIVSASCAKCHPSNFTYQDVANAKAGFKAALRVLGNLLVEKSLGTLNLTTGDFSARKLVDSNRSTGPGSVSEQNMGAIANYQLFELAAADTAAYVHNPAWARKLVFDSIDWLDDGIMNNSSAAEILEQANRTEVPAGQVAVTTTDGSSAIAFTNDPGCLGCHYGSGINSSANGDIPGIQAAPHYNTNGALVPGQTFTQAQFVVPGTQCNYCHGYGHGTDSPRYSAAKASFPNISTLQGKGILKNYAESAHGEIDGLAWTDYNFLNLASRASCSPCHTTKGFVAAVANANANGGRITATPFLGNANDTTKQVLGCDACHNSTNWKSSVRTINGGYVAGMGGYPGVATINYPDVGESNVCVPCHAGRENGASINASTADFSNTTFKNPHYLAASAVFYGKGGFQFYTSSVRYNTYGAAGKVGRNANWSHGRLGMDNYTAAKLSTANAGAVRGTGNQGQCVACHMGPTNTHTYNAYEVAKATWGTSTTQKGCFGCHGTEDMEEVAVGEKANVDRALDFLAYELEQYGLFFNNDKNPYFFNTGDPALQADATKALNWTANPYGLTVTGKQTMGAAQNLKLLKAEKGSHVHNRTFMRALITDSLVYLQKGQTGIDADRNIRDAEINNIIRFSTYSTAVSAPNTDRLAGKSGSTTSISGLKGYLTRNSGGLYYRR